MQYDIYAVLAIIATFTAVSAISTLTAGAVIYLLKKIRLKAPAQESGDPKSEISFLKERIESLQTDLEILTEERDKLYRLNKRRETPKKPKNSNISLQM